MKVIDSIRAKLKLLPQGEPFVLSQFFSLGSPTAVRKHLSDLAKQGAIRRVARGVYVIQKEDTPPITADKIALAVAKAGKYRAKLIWTDRVRRSVFITDGPARRIRMNEHRILMRHVNPHAFDRAGLVPESFVVERASVAPVEPIRRIPGIPISYSG